MLGSYRENTDKLDFSFKIYLLKQTENSRQLSLP